MKRILTVLLFVIPMPAYADAQMELDTSFFISTHHYAQIRIGSDACGLPAGEWISYKARVLEALAQDPKIDVLKAQRDMDRYYEQEKDRMGNECSNAHRNLFRTAVGRMDDEIRTLRERVRKAR